MAIKFLTDINTQEDIQFQNSSGTNAGKIAMSGDDLVLSNAVGDILFGDTDSDIYIGDGVNNVDVLFEQSGSIKAEDGSSGVTLTLGSSDTTLSLYAPKITNLSTQSSEATALMINGSNVVGTRELGSLAFASSINNSDWSGTDLAIVNGGTGASTASGARTNLGLGTISTSSSGDFASSYVSSVTDTTWSSTRDSQWKFSAWDANGKSWTPSTEWWWGLTLPHASNSSSYNYGGQIVIRNHSSADTYVRSISNGTANDWKQVWTEANFANNSTNWNTAYGWGNHATQNYLTSINNSNWSGTDLAIANGGTGASTAAAARTNLGLGSMATANTSDYDNYSSWNLVDQDDATNRIDSADYVKIANASITGTGTSSDPFEVQISTGGNGTVTNVTVGTGLDVSNGTTTPSITLDLSELTDMTAAVNTSQDELILLDNGAERRKLFSEVFGSAAYVASSTFATSAQGTNADTAYGWGDHSTAGYLTSETFGSSDVVMSLDGNDLTAGVSVTLAGGLSYNASTNTLSQTDNNTTYSTATSSTAGLVKIGYTENGKNYPVELSSGQMYVNVPWTDTNTTYSTATSSTLGLVKIGYTENGKNYPVELSSGQMYVNVPWTDTNTTYSVATTSANGLMSSTDKSKLDGIAASANNYSLPAGSSTVRGGFKIGYTESGKNYPVEVASEKMYVNVPWTDTNTTYSTATSSTLGLVKIGYTENGKNYPVELSSGQMYVNVPWTDTDTNTQLTDAQVRSKVSGTGLIGYNSSTGVISTSADNYSNWNLLDNADNTNRIDSNEYVKFSGADISGTGTSSDPFIVTTPNTTYTADGNYGMTLNGTAFRLENDRRRNSNTQDIHTGNTHDYTFYDADIGIRWYTAGAEEMRLEDDGDLHVDGDVIAYSTTVSDERLKDDVETIENACEKVCNLRGVEYTWNEGSRKGQREIGVIAQEVEKVVPEIVHEKELPFVDGGAYKTVDYEKIVALLIEANKELCNRVQTLEAKLDGITE